LFVLALQLSNLLKVTGFGLMPGGNLLLIPFAQARSAAFSSVACSVL
jgi:hypothetical protein